MILQPQMADKKGGPPAKSAGGPPARTHID